MTLLQKLYEPIKQGNAYRIEKYGSEPTQAKELRQKQKSLTKKQPLFKTNAVCAKEDLFKSKFGYWDCWTGGRYDRVTNPNPTDDTDMNAICRSNPVTGEWEAL